MPKGIYPRSDAHRAALRAAFAERRRVAKIKPAKLALKDLYWLAGLLEGEGSFVKGPPSRPWRPQITVQMTDEDVIKRVAALLGVGYCACSTQESHHKTPYSVQQRGRTAVAMMLALKPLMGTRRQHQIEEAVNSYFTK